MIGIKDQCFGVEIELTGITRAEAAEALGAYFETTPQRSYDNYDIPAALLQDCVLSFLTASNAIHKDGISSLKYGPRGGLRRFARPTHRTSHIDLADCTKSCIRLCVFRGRIGFCEF